MFWIRTFAFGFLGSLFVLLLAGMPPPPGCTVAQAPPGAAPRANVTVLAVCAGVSGDMLARLLVLDADERIVAVDDVPVESGVAALATHDVRSRAYIDVAIADRSGATRRALVLLR